MLFSIIIGYIVHLIVRIINYFSNKQKIECFPNGKIKRKEEFYVINKKKQLHGSVKIYYENGNTKEHLEYQNDLLNGVQKYFNDNGKLVKKDAYESGILIASFPA
tara:strand:+ start:3386 stop:3700 length:315 start_codon:yes stop_codon:yes gene_type:complete